MTTGLKMIKEELGPDALIISTKSIKSGKFGMLGKSGLEITAAVTPAPVNTRKPETLLRKTNIRQVPPRQGSIDHRLEERLTYEQMTNERDALFNTNTDRFANNSNQPYQNQHISNTPSPNTQYQNAKSTPNKKQPYHNSGPTPSSSQPYQNSTAAQQTSGLRDRLPGVNPALNQHRQEIQPPPRQETASQFQSPRNLDNAFNNNSRNAESSTSSSEMEDLKNMVRSLAGEISKLQTDVNEPQINNNQSSPEPIFDLLKSKGINEEISLTIANFLQANLDPRDLQNPIELNRHTTDSIQSMIEVAPPFKQPKNHQQRMAFVGPTGVGKTTTLAKLAASRIGSGNTSVAMITIDTYRIAAVEQLKVYGEIMNIPVEVVLSPEQLEHALIKHRDCDLILIDTAGRSPKDSLSIDELASFLKEDLNIENHLVLSATARETELLDAMTRFDKLNIHSTIYTKIDECSQLGALLNVQSHNNNPISCLTNGQRVPEDIVDISSQRVAELIMSAN